MKIIKTLTDFINESTELDIPSKEIIKDESKESVIDDDGVVTIKNWKIY